MKLWELRCTSESLAVGLGKPPRLIGATVRADSEAEARKFASLESRDELGHIWLDDKLTTCVEIEPLADGNPGVVLTQWIGSSPDLAGSTG